MTDRPILFSGPMVRAILDGRKTQTRRVLKLVGVMPDYIGPAGCEDDPTCWGWEMDSGGYVTVEGDAKDHPPGWRNGWRDWAGAYAPGDRLWVRETWARSDKHSFLTAYRADGQCGAWCWDGDGRPAFLHHGRVIDPARRDGGGNYGLPKFGGRWSPSIHMPRWASRLALIIEDVRLERLRDISEADAVAEGARQQHRIGDGPEHAPWTMTGEGWRHDTPREAFQYLWDSLSAKRGYGWNRNPWVVALTFRAIGENIDRLEGAS